MPFEIMSDVVPKEYKKKKIIKMYKAYILKDGQTMNISTDLDLLSFTHEAAVCFAISLLDVGDISLLKGKTINFAVFDLPIEVLDMKVVDEGEVYNQDLTISITLKDKTFSIDVEDMLIEDIKIEVDTNTEIKKVKSVKLAKV